MLSDNMPECPPVLLAAAKAFRPVRTAIVNAGAHLPMASAAAAFQAGLIDPVLFGEPDAINFHAKNLDWDISALSIIEAGDEQTAAKLAAEAAGAGEVSSLMKGDIHTDIFLGKILEKQSGLRTARRLTHVFHISIPGDDGVLLITDGAVNVHPDFETKKSIIANAVNLAHAIGISTPKVALLSATEEVNPAIPSSIEAAKLTEWATANITDAMVSGPLAFDLAVSSEAAHVKKFENPVAGSADIIVVPEIVTGNALFKVMVYFMGACAAGIVLGAKVPIVLTSRADPPEARLASAALASIIGSGSSKT